MAGFLAGYQSEEKEGHHDGPAKNEVVWCGFRDVHLAGLMYTAEATTDALSAACRPNKLLLCTHFQHKQAAERQITNVQSIQPCVLLRPRLAFRGSGQERIQAATGHTSNRYLAWTESTSLPCRRCLPHHRRLNTTGLVFNDRTFRVCWISRSMASGCLPPHDDARGEESKIGVSFIHSHVTVEHFATLTSGWFGNLLRI